MLEQATKPVEVVESADNNNNSKKPMNPKDLVPSLILGGAIVVGLIFGLKAPVVNVAPPGIAVNVPSNVPDVQVNVPASQVPDVNVNVPEQPVGASGNNFSSGIYVTKYGGLNSVSASTTTSTAVSALALRDGAHGQITLGTSTPVAGTLTNVVRASTTAVSSNSMVFVQQSLSTTLPGVTCNTSPTTTPVTAVFSSSTNPSLNGFSVTTLSTPTTNPICLNYWILDRSN